MSTEIMYTENVKRILIFWESLLLYGLEYSVFASLKYINIKMRLFFVLQDKGDGKQTAGLNVWV